MKKSKFSVVFFVLLILVFALSACKNPAQTGGGTTNGETGGSETVESEGGDENNNREVSEMYVTVNGNKLKVTLENNSSTAALIELLRQGDIVYTAHGNNFEIYGDIGHALPTNNTQITSQAGDVLLWAGSNICIFFGNNSYSYTRIGKIEGYTAGQLKTMLGGGSGSVQVTISLT